MTALPQMAAEQPQNSTLEDEARLRVDLAAAFRLAAHFGWDDLIFTHMSVRIPGPEHHFLINPFNLLFTELTASQLLRIDQTGQPVAPTPHFANPAGFTIHSAIHMARPDAHAIIHLHTPNGQAVSAMKFALLPHTQTAMLAAHEIAFHDYEGVATDLDERERLVADLGAKNILILRNHGMLTVGETIADAFLRMYFLERACDAQVRMLSAGLENLHAPPAGMPEKVEAQSKFGQQVVARQLVWPALLRLVDRLDPSYKT